MDNNDEYDLDAADQHARYRKKVRNTMAAMWTVIALAGLMATVCFLAH